MEINTQDFITDCMSAINEKIKNLKTLNIVVAGKTGVGKSTLINYIFRENLAETGIGKPVTQHMKQITKRDFPLTIYDTKGLELGRDTQLAIKKEIIEKIREGIYSKDQNKCIHCIWYCINTSSDRIEDDEIAWIKEFSEENKELNVPIIIILTKAFSKPKAREFQSYIDNLNLNVCAVVPVLALDYEIDEDYTVKAYGADNLIEIMGEALGDELIKTLHNVQRAAIKQKVDYAHKVVAVNTAAAFGEGCIPIPLADSAMLIPTQVSMIAEITVIFGMKVDKAILTAFVSATLGVAGTTITGKTIAANLLKLVPGAGSILGGMISSSTAAVLTTALGEAYIKLMEQVAMGALKSEDIAGDKGLDLLKGLFKREIKMKK